MISTNEFFLNLVRLGVGTTNKTTIPHDIRWDDVEALAYNQGLLGVVVDGIERLPQEQRPSKDKLLQWIGETLQGFEHQYGIYEKKIAELSCWYNVHGFKMMLLKGYACGLNWPKPEHRPCGDIDIWLFGRQKEADAALAKEKGIKVDSSHHHHTVFDWGNITVENHYDFINVYDYKSSKEIEKILKELGRDDSYFTEVYDEKVYLPSPNLHALFLIRHAVSHFASSFITLRQVLDWAFFVEKQGKDVDWRWLEGLLKHNHMMEFYNCINAICVEELGFPSSIFSSVQFSPVIKDKILQDILFTDHAIDEPKQLLQRLVFKFRRWKDNVWKRELCFAEGYHITFWRGIWYHIIKPSSI